LGFALVLLVLLEGVAAAWQPAAGRSRRAFPRPGAERTMGSTVAPVEIHSGFVIFEGRYVDPPYIVESERGRTCINGFEMAQGRSRGFRRVPGGGGRPSRMGGSRDVLRIEQHLRNEGLLICPKGDQALYLSAERAIALFEVLMADESIETKVQTLIKAEPSVMAASQWISLVETFETPPGLADRLAELEEHQAMLELDPIEEPWLGKMPMTGATVLGFALAVWALGTLLGCRPPTRLDPSSADMSAHAARQVVRLVVLIVILGAYDLACTLCAEHVGGLWEVNPFARSLVARDSSVTAFKLTLTLGGGLLLVAARRSRLAQVGSWWIGVLYTVLILRWATYNSVFMA